MSAIAQLPAKWASGKIGEISDVNPRLDKSRFASNLEVCFVPMHAVGAENGKIDVSARRRFAEVEKGYTGFKQGDVLFAKITPCMENGKMAVVPEVHGGLGFGSTEFHVLRPTVGIFAKYLYYFVSSKRFRADAEHNMTGAVGQRRVPTTYLAESEIPLPPLAEQHRIVAKIEELFSELDKGIENLKQARAQLAVYRQALLKNAFEGKLTADWRAKIRPPKAKPSETPHQIESWTLSTLGNLTEYITSGSRGWAEFYSDSGPIFIRAANLNRDTLDLSEVVYVSLPKGAEGTRTRTSIGDVFITITGANVTKTGYLDRDLGEAYVSQHVALCRPIDPTMSEYLYFWIISKAGGRRDLEKAAYGAGKPGLNLDNLRTLRVPVASHEEMPLIVAAIRSNLASIQSLEADIATNLQKAEALRQSILKKAFSGELVPQDPADEPASVLLARIRAERAAAGVRKKQLNHR